MNNFLIQQIFFELLACHYLIHTAYIRAQIGSLIIDKFFKLLSCKNNKNSIIISEHNFNLNNYYYVAI